ncbi:MAG: serine/threonine-protein phosphatase [Coriobacteriaceae bacterium]|jgi:serine/threonine protein phosphatase PrpC|nr:serine/threonine-protein phosphatase [Coriobacteriaceae bacterium]
MTTAFQSAYHSDAAMTTAYQSAYHTDAAMTTAFSSAYHTDSGPTKALNQDSLLLMEASLDATPLFLAVVCDGMGGLELGEVASAMACRAFRAWFQDEAPRLCREGLWSEGFSENGWEGGQGDGWESGWEGGQGDGRESGLRASLTALVAGLNEELLEFGRSQGIALGTTLAALFLSGDAYCALHVGDSRIYALLPDSVEQLTRDHSLVQYELDNGTLSMEEALVDDRRNVLLRCVGVDEGAVPDFAFGTALHGMTFVLCSDGFYRRTTPDEIHQRLNPVSVGTEEQLALALAGLTQQALERGETDNLSAIAVRVGGCFR